MAKNPNGKESAVTVLRDKQTEGKKHMEWSSGVSGNNNVHSPPQHKTNTTKTPIQQLKTQLATTLCMRMVKMAGDSVMARREM